MWSFPSEWEEVIWRVARAALPPEAVEGKALAAAIAERSDRYTRDRERLSAPVPARERARDLAARSLFFTIADAPKVAVAIAELRHAGRVPGAEPLRVLDVGAGVGAMTLGLAMALPGRELVVEAIDRDAAALELFARIARELPREGALTVTTRAADATRELPPGPFDVVLAGTMLNELPPAARVELVSRMVTSTTEEGVVILVEPALRETARALHGVRDAILEAGTAAVFAPCTRAGAPCPALADEKDWCHEDRPFTPPPRFGQLARATGLRREGLKFAYLTLVHARARQSGWAHPEGSQAGGAHPQEDPSGRAHPEESQSGRAHPILRRRALRVVSGPLDVKGSIDRIVCSDEGRHRMRILRRDLHHRNRAFRRSARGDVLLVGDDGAVEVVRPASDPPPSDDAADGDVED